MKKDKNKIVYEVWSADAVHPTIGKKRLIASKAGALSYAKWLRTRFGHNVNMAVVFAGGCSVVFQLHGFMMRPGMHETLAPLSWLVT